MATFEGWSPPLEDWLRSKRQLSTSMLETLPADERDGLLSREILTTSVEVHA